MGEPQLVLQLGHLGLVTVGLLPFLGLQKGGKLLTTLARGSPTKKKGLLVSRREAVWLGRALGEYEIDT